MVVKLSQKAYLLTAITVLVVGVAGAYLLRVRGDHLSAQLKTPESPDVGVPTSEAAVSKKIQLTDTKPFLPVCSFWQPWISLVKPESPRVYLETISKLLQGQSDRSEKYLELIMRDPGMMGALRGDPEHICITGLFEPSGNYNLSAQEDSTCKKKPAKFLEQNLDVKITPLEVGGFENHVKFTMHVGTAIPAQFREFWLQQMSLFQQGYRGWSEAFKEYHQINQNGFGLVAIEPSRMSPNVTPLGQGATTELRFDWLTQAMMSTKIDWATFLLKLGDLAQVDMWTATHYPENYEGPKPYEGGILGSKIETRLASVTLKVPLESRKLFESPTEVPVVLGHDVFIKFRGIEVNVKGLRYRGIFHSDDSQFAFDGWFEGVDQVEIAGAYRGLGMGSAFGKMIHDLVKDAIDREIARLKKGHLMEPARLRLGLYKNGTQGQFEIEARFDAAINLLNIIREEKDQVDSPVMPNKKTIKNINHWGQETLTALVKDFDLNAECMGALPAAVQ